MAKVDMWMPLYVNDYLGDTMHLTAEENGIYLLLMMHYWKMGKLHDNIEKLAIVSRSTADKTLEILEEFFIKSDGFWLHKRVEKEMENALSRRDASRINGRKGGRPRNLGETYRLSEGIPTANLDHNLQKSSSPSPSQEEIKNPPTPQRGNGLSYDFIEDKEWKTLFKSWAKNKKNPYRKQLGLKKGFTQLQNLSDNNLEVAQQIIDTSLANNWAGLFALQKAGPTHVIAEKRQPHIGTCPYCFSENVEVTNGHCQNCTNQIGMEG
jgi:uncharacterized protein YdaU (DUF1376 family)